MNTITLKKRQDFLRIAKAGRKFVARAFVLQIAPTGAEAQGGALRYGLTVSRKTSKSAVIRNRIKRRLRALVQQVLSTRADTAYDYVLIGRVGADRYPWARLEADMLKALYYLKVN